MGGGRGTEETGEFWAWIEAGARDREGQGHHVRAALARLGLFNLAPGVAAEIEA